MTKTAKILSLPLKLSLAKAYAAREPAIKQIKVTPVDTNILFHRPVLKALNVSVPTICPGDACNASLPVKMAIYLWNVSGLGIQVGM
ncbi:MAG TPA: hypothetical protein GX506_11930 [Firmicutes bacterium]|nr:hypothetical protein [Bacillota bacterium]